MDGSSPAISVDANSVPITVTEPLDQPIAVAEPVARPFADPLAVADDHAGPADHDADGRSGCMGSQVQR